MTIIISQLPTVMISRHDSSILENMTYIPGTFLRARIYAREHPSFDPASAILVALGASTAMLAAWLSAGSERRIVCGGKLKTSNNPDSTAAGVEGELCIQTADCLDLVPVQERRPSDTSSISRKNLFSDLVQNIGVQHALLFVVVSSCSLVLLFYFIRDVIMFVIVLYCFAASSAMTFILSPAVERMSPSLKKEVHVPIINEKASIGLVITSLLSLSLASIWFATRHSIYAIPLQDVMAIFLCIHIISLVKFQNFEACAALLSLALLYDVFWVFISPLLFRYPLISPHLALSPPHSHTHSRHIATGVGAQRLGDTEIWSPLTPLLGQLFGHDWRCHRKGGSEERNRRFRADRDVADVAQGADDARLGWGGHATWTW